MGPLRVDRIAGPPRPLVVVGGPVLVERCHLARTRTARALGLLGTRDLRRDEALWLEPCSSVHTFGMSLALDLAFIGPTGRVLRIRPDVRPRRVVCCRDAHAVVEARAGALAGRIAVGERLSLAPFSADFPALCAHRVVKRG